MARKPGKRASRGRVSYRGTGRTPPPTPAPVLPHAPRVRSAATARRLLGKLIAAFCRGELADAAARTLSYLLSTYVAVTRDTELEAQVADLAQRVAEQQRRGEHF